MCEETIRGHCRKCGCHGQDACWGDETGACWWEEADLCSACAGVQPDAARDDLEFTVYEADAFLPSAPSVAICNSFADAVEAAARHKGYVVSVDGSVVWVSPRLDIYSTMAAMVRGWSPQLEGWLRARTEDIRNHLRAHRVSEAA